MGGWGTGTGEKCVQNVVCSCKENESRCLTCAIQQQDPSRSASGGSRENIARSLWAYMGGWRWPWISMTFLTRALSMHHVSLIFPSITFSPEPRLTAVRPTRTSERREIPHKHTHTLQYIACLKTQVTSILHELRWSPFSPQIDNKLRLQIYTFKV